MGGLMLRLTRRARVRRVNALYAELRTARRVASVALRDLADARATLEVVAARDGELASYITLCQRLHVAEHRVAELEEAAGVR